MAVIPQYSAGAPPQARGPILEQAETVRVDPRAALSSMNGLMDVIAKSSTQLPELPNDFGQGKAKGLRAIGEGVSRLGAVFQKIDEEEATARNTKTVFDFQQGMRRLYGDFEVWTANEGAMESQRWGEEWSTRLGQWKGEYFQGREIAPAAQEAIDMGFARFETETVINTKVRSAQDAFKQAKGAASQAWAMAVDSGELDTARTITSENAGTLFHTDEVARMDYEAQQKIRERNNKILENQKDTALAYGDINGALAAVQAKDVRPDEKALETAVVTEQFGYQERIRSVQEIEDPMERIKALNAREYEQIRKPDRDTLMNEAYREINNENIATVESFKVSIDKAGGLSQELVMTDAFKALPQSSKNALGDYAITGAKNDISEYLAALRSAQAYDPTNDTRGDELRALQEQATLRFDSKRAKDITDALKESQTRTGPKQAIERVETDYLSFLQKRYDNGDFGDFRVGGGEIIREEGEDGAAPSYYVADPQGEMPEVKSLGRDTPRRRKITLAEEDRMKFESTPRNKRGTMIIEDQIAKEQAFLRFQATQQEIVRRRKAGEITNADEMSAVGASLLGSEIRDAAARNVQTSQGNQMPSNSWGTPGSPSLEISSDYEKRIEETLKKWDELQKEN